MSDRYVGKAMPEVDDAIFKNVDITSNKAFTSDPELYWKTFFQALKDHEAGLTGTDAQNAILALAAVNVICPVAGNVLQDKGWLEGTRGYTRVKFIYSYLNELLLNSGKKIHLDILDTLMRDYDRKGGDFRSPNWPPAKFKRFYDESIWGVANPVSYAVSRIIRDGALYFAKLDKLDELDNLDQINDAEQIKTIITSAEHDYKIFELIERILAIEKFDGDIDLLLQIADIAVEIGIPLNIVIKQVRSRGFLVEENGLIDLYNEITRKIESGYYHHLKLSET